LEAITIVRTIHAAPSAVTLSSQRGEPITPK
jgi:hypothetical protein